MGQISTLVVTIGAVSLLASDSLWSQDAGVKLSNDELASYLPGTKAALVTSDGMITYRWTNELDGQFVASWAKTVALGLYTATTGRGTWRISDDGKYCVTIELRHRISKWCQFVFRTSDGGFYMSQTDDPTARRTKIELIK